MRTYTLLARNLAWYWRTNLAVLLGVATATGVLGGAALVGESVRATLRDLVLERLGNTDSIVTRNGFFREELAAALQPAAPVIALDGVVEHEASGNRAVGVEVYGVYERLERTQPAPKSSSPRLSRANSAPSPATKFCCAFPSPRPFRSKPCTAEKTTSARPSG